MKISKIEKLGKWRKTYIKKYNDRNFYKVEKKRKRKKKMKWKKRINENFEKSQKLEKLIKKR